MLQNWMFIGVNIFGEVGEDHDYFENINLVNRYNLLLVMIII